MTMPLLALDRTSSYMSFKEKIIILKAFVETQFECCRS